MYLSDGGHFENSGISELLRWRCKYILAVDGTGKNPKGDLTFGGLGIAVRRARIDFGVIGDIDLRPMMRDPQTGRGRSHFAVGRIRYPKPDGTHGSADSADDPYRGLLLFIKASRVEGATPPDILHYSRAVNPDFPHDSTADQQFDQPQFESYRELGFIAGREVSANAGEEGSLADRLEKLDVCYQELLKGAS